MRIGRLEIYLHEQLEARTFKNACENEQKYRIRIPEPLRKRLQRLGAVKKGDGYEHNELFDWRGKLKKRGMKLRLRRHGPGHAWLTLKGPKQKGRHKKRLEVETPVHYENTKRILELLRYRIFETYAKNREEYHLGNCIICLDYLPDCGWFVEIEGTPKHIHRTARRLGLEHKSKEHRSYRKIIKHAHLIAAKAKRKKK